MCACVHEHVHICACGAGDKFVHACMYMCMCVHVHGHANVLLREFRFVSFSFCHVCNAHMCVHELLHCISRWACEHVGRSACGHVGMWVCGQVGKSVRSRCFVQNFDRFVSFRFRVSKCACLRTAVCVSSLVAAACGHADMACEHMGMWACEPVGMCVCVNV